jgi:hypothetical protein
MPRKKAKPIPADAPAAEQPEAAKHDDAPAASEINPPADDADIDFDPAKIEAAAPRPKTPDELFAGRDWVKFADPFPRHSARWPDGYEITFQTSSSRDTVEIQFGDGGTRDKPKNDEIRTYLKDQGMRWNGSNAWVIDLVPERGSMRDRLEARDRNRQIREQVEDEVLPWVVALEEEKRGPIESDVLRERINQLRAGHGR